MRRNPMDRHTRAEMISMPESEWRALRAETEEYAAALDRRAVTLWKVAALILLVVAGFALIGGVIS